MPSQPKAVAVYVDESAKCELTDMRLSPREILDYTVGTYRYINDLDLSYNLDFLPVLNWYHSVQLALKAIEMTKSGNNKKDRFDSAIQAMADEAEKIFNSISIDVAVFFTGLIPSGNGCAPYSHVSKGDGSGAMIIGIGSETFRKENYFRPSFFSSVRNWQEIHLQNAFLREISAVCSHEQGHLFGLDHSELESSIMYAFSSSNQRNFDYK